MGIKNYLVRGDTHGNFNWMYNGCLNDYTPEETAIIVLGDVGFNFYLNKTDQRKKKEVNERGYRFYCVRGNHEARPRDIKGMELVWDDDVSGEVYMEPDFPNIRYFMDYGIYNIAGYSVAVISGAYSVDKWYRLAQFGITDKFHPDYANVKKTGWFYNEQLSTVEMEDCMNLMRGGSYDFVFTHTCPIDWEPSDLFLGFVDQSTVDKSMEIFLSNLSKEIEWNTWCWAHFHTDRLERPHVEQYYNDIESLDVIQERWKKYDKTGELDWFLVKSPNFYME